MALVLNEEQGMLRDSVDAFLAERAPVKHLRDLRDRRDAIGYDPGLWRQFAEQGYSAVLVPEADGGLGLGAVEAGIISEALGHTLTPSPFLSTAVVAARALVRAGSAAQKARLLPAIATAGVVLALAVDESAKHSPDAIATRALVDGGGLRIDGAKTFVIDGHVARELIVAARSSDQGMTLCLVDAAAPGVRIERTHMLDAHNSARVRFDGLRVAADAVLGRIDGGAQVLDEVLDLGRAVVAAQLLGAADEVFARTLAYLKERKQFDRYIGEFQALQHRIAELFIDIELTRVLVLRALQALDQDPQSARLAVAQAKAHACTSANRAVQEGVQMHGGIGMTDEFDIGLFMKRARTLQELYGDAGFHTDRVAALGGY